MVYGTVLIHTIHYRLIDLLALIPSSTVAAVEVLLVRTAAATDFESRSKQEKVCFQLHLSVGQTQTGGCLTPVL